MDKYKINSSVFYRLYGDKVVLYHTRKQKVFLFNATVNDILECFKNESDMPQAIDNLSKVFIVEDTAAFEKSIMSFAEQLAELGIIEKAFKHIEVENDLSSAIPSILPPHTLYSATIELTYRCNERCRHCYAVDEEKGELSTEEVFRILDELSELNVLQLTFTGGEVFVRKDFMDILAYAYKKHFMVTIFTNGNLITDTDLIKMVELHLSSIHFSIYSHIKEKHDYITQINGSFDKTVEVIKKTVLLGIPTNIKTTIMEYTKKDVEGIIALAKELSATLQLGLVINPKNNGDTSPIGLRMQSVEDYAEVLKIAEENTEFCSGIARDLIDLSDESVCGAGKHTICISPYGEVYPCNALRINLGNIRSSSIRDIWDNSTALKEWRAFRLKDLKGCADCDLLKTLGRCSFCPGAALNEKGDPMARYDEACIISKAQNSLRS